MTGTTSTPLRDLRPEVVLDRMADELDRNGHVRNYLQDPNGTQKKCVRGAYNHVVFEDPLAYGERHDTEVPVAEALALVLGDQLPAVDTAWPGRWSAVIKWNNEEGRTGDEVSAACRRAAARLREEIR